MDRNFFQNVFKLAGATAVVQAIGIILTPIFSRIFTPDVVGQFAVFNSIIGILGVMGTGAYEHAIMLPKEKKDAISLVFGSLLLVFIWIFVISIILYLFGKSIANIGEYEFLDKYFLFIPFVVFFICINRINLYWCNRNERFGLNATINILNATIMKCSNILFGLLGYVALATLVLINLIVIFAEGIFRIFVFVHENSKFILDNISVNQIKRNLIRYKRFPLIGMWTGLLDTGSILITPILLVGFFSSTEVGLYNQSLTLVQLPIALIASSMGQVLFQKLSTVKAATEELSEIITNTFAFLLHISIPIFVVIFFWGGDLFSFFLGERWKLSGIYASLLTPWCCLKMCFSPLSVLFNILEKQEFSLFLTIGIILSRVLSVLIGGFFQDMYLTILLIGITGALANLSGLIMIFRLSNSGPVHILKALFRNQFHK